MKKIELAAIIILTSLFLISCKNDPDTRQAFSTSGCWRRNIFCVKGLWNCKHPKWYHPATTSNSIKQVKLFVESSAPFANDYSFHLIKCR